MSADERALSETQSMDVLGNPRSWSLVTQGLHPFVPERTAVLPPGARFHYGERCGGDLRREIDHQIEHEFGHMQGFDKRWFPDKKRESIYWMIERITDHYGTNALFREWVVGLAGREIIGSTAYCGCGFAHQYQRGGSVPLDCLPVDWWLFLFPGGFDWAALDKEPIYAVMCNVVRDGEFTHAFSVMLPIYILAQDVWREVSNSDTGWRGVARMGRIAACRHLNQIVARCLPENYL